MTATIIANALQDVPNLDDELSGRVRLLSRGAGLKASVLLFTCQKQKLVIKDYSATPWYLKPVARYLVHRERRVLQSLSACPYAPDFLKSIDAYSFAMEHIEGEHPSVATRSARDLIYQNAHKALAGLHSAGYTHNDLHSRNILIHPFRGVIFIDLAAAVRFGTDDCSGRMNPTRWLKHCLQGADYYNLVKRKRLFSAVPHHESERTLLSQGRPFKGVTRWWKRWIRLRPQRRFRLH